MPKVPLRGQRVEENVLPSARITTPSDIGAFGGIEADTISTIGRGVTQLGELELAREDAEEAAISKHEAARVKAQAKLKQERDKLRADNATFEWSDWYRGKSPDYFNTKGIDSIDVTTRANKDIEAFNKTLIDKADSDEEREFLRVKLASKREVALNNIQAHEVDQHEATKKATNQKVMENSIRTASDPNSGALDRLDAEIDLRDAIDIASEGMTGPQKKSLKAEMLTLYHTSIINANAVTNLPLAQEYFNETKKEISPDERAATEKVLKVEDTLQSAQAASDEIFLTEGDSAKRTRMARDFKHTGTDAEKAEKRKETESQVDKRNKALEQLDKEKQQEAFLTSLNNIDKAQNQTDGDLIAKRLEDPIDRGKALKHSETRFTRKTKDVVTDRDMLGKVLARVYNGEFKDETELLEFFSIFSRPDYKWVTSEFGKYQQELKTGKKADDGEIKYSTAKDAFSVALGVKYDIEDEEQNVEFLYAFDKLRDMGITDFGKAKDEIRKLVIDGEVVGQSGKFTLYDPNLSRAEAEATDQLDRWLPFILTEEDDAGAEKNSIMAEFRKDGITVYSDLLAKLYKKNRILGLPLSDAEAAQYEYLWKRSKTISGGR